MTKSCLTDPYILTFVAKALTLAIADVDMGKEPSCAIEQWLEEYNEPKFFAPDNLLSVIINKSVLLENEERLYKACVAHLPNVKEPHDSWESVLGIDIHYFESDDAVRLQTYTAYGTTLQNDILTIDTSIELPLREPIHLDYDAGHLKDRMVAFRKEATGASLREDEILDAWTVACREVEHSDE